MRRLLLVAHVACGGAFLAKPRSAASVALRAAKRAKRKGFGAITAPPAAAPAPKRKGFGDGKFSKSKPKTAAKVEKERAASAYDAAKASGVPEYRVYVTPTGTEQWTPIGCVTVPRTESVSQSIFGNEESLLQVARQAGVKGDLDYGYNRAIFPDDPVTPADRAEALRSTNPLQRFAKDLTNPLGFGGSK